MYEQRNFCELEDYLIVIIILIIAGVFLLGILYRIFSILQCLERMIKIQEDQNKILNDIYEQIGKAAYLMITNDKDRKS